MNEYCLVSLRRNYISVNSLLKMWLYSLFSVKRCLVNLPVIIFMIVVSLFLVKKSFHEFVKYLSHPACLFEWSFQYVNLFFFLNYTEYT